MSTPLPKLKHKQVIVGFYNNDTYFIQFLYPAGAHMSSTCYGKKKYAYIYIWERKMLQKVPVHVVYQLQSPQETPIFQREFPRHPHTWIVVPIQRCRQ